MERIPLWERAPLFEESFGQPAPSLTPYLLPGGGARGAVIVCPGGGYVVKADHEGAPIAERLNKLGFHAFVLDYRVAPYRHPVPLLDVQRAIRLVRHRAQEFGVLPDKIAILGFSAGGHLVCTAATHYDAGDPAALDPIDRESCRPDLFVPCYAVASLTGFCNEGSKHSLLTKNTDPRQLRALTAEFCVTEDTPPCFLWHTAEDGSVPVENSLRLAAALTAHNVPVSLHVFPFGPHGVGLGREDSPLPEDWPDLMADFLRTMGF